MSALPARTRDTSRRVAAGAPVEGHGQDPPDSRTRRDTGATPPPPPDSAIGRKLAELAATLHKAGQIAECLALDVENGLAGTCGQSVMDDVSEATPSTRAEQQPLVLETLLTVADLAQLLRLDERTVRRMRKRGSLPPAIDLGSVLRWRKSDIDAWLDERREGAVA